MSHLMKLSRRMGVATSQGRKVWIIEGSCPDTKFQEKLYVKMGQHQALSNILANNGYRVTLAPIILGNTECQ